MRANLRFAASLLFLAGTGMLWGGQAGQSQLRWGELAERVTGRKVALALPDGTRIEGKVRGVETDALRLQVSKTSDRQVIAKGERLVPRQSVSVLRVTEYRKLGRLLVTLGAVGIAAAIVAADYPDIYEGPALIAVPAVVAAGITGVGIAGYYTGKLLDKRVIEIRIISDSPAARP